MNMLRLPGADRAGAVGAVLGAHLARLRTAVGEKDRGASAIELAIISAVLVGLAVVILTIIYHFAQGQANTIQNHTIPGG